MFGLIMKQRGPVGNIFKRHAAKRQINNNALLRTFARKDEMSIKNVKIQYCVKHSRMNYINDRKYSTLPEPIEERKPKKLFVSDVDSFAHSILESKEIYSGNLAKDLPVYHDVITESEIDNYINKSWKALPTPEIVEAFKRMSFYASMNNESIIDEKYRKFIQYLITNCKQFTDSEIYDVLLSICLWPVHHTRLDPVFECFYSALDAECVRRAPQWTVDELLLACDHWYKVKLLKYTKFSSESIKKIGSKPRQLSASNLVQFMFYVNSTSHQPRAMYNLESRMEFCVDEFDINELSILAMGFFKSHTPIRNSNLLVKIIGHVIKDIDTIHEIALSAFFTIIGYSSTVHNQNAILWELFVATVPQIPRLSLQALIHVVTTTAKIRVFHPELLTAIARRFNDNIKDARVKDMKHLVLALTCFNFTPDIQSNIFETIVEELRTAERSPDLSRYQKSLANLLQYLSVVNIYPKDLISLILDPENLKATYGASPYDLHHAILVLDLNADVEIPDYIGPRLTNQQRTIIARRYADSLPELNEKSSNMRHNFLLEIIDTCKEIFGSTEMLHLDWILPQYREVDIILCLDENNSPLPVAQSISEIPYGDVKRRPEIYPEGCKWFALVTGVVSCYTRNSEQLLGKTSVKIRQLEKLGYKPIVISCNDWHTFRQDRKSYLEEILFK